MMIPIASAREKSFRTTPPNKRSARHAMNVVREVITVRLSTSFTLRLIVSENVLFFRRRMFSRIRSKTTTVSVSEYPPMVRRAVMKRRSISLPSR